MERKEKEKQRSHLINIQVKAPIIEIMQAEIKIGDWVLVDPAALNRATLVPINDNDDRVILVSPFDVIQIW